MLLHLAFFGVAPSGRDNPGYSRSESIECDVKEAIRAFDDVANTSDIPNQNLLMDDAVVAQDKSSGILVNREPTRDCLSTTENEHRYKTPSTRP